jgi:uncharacterized protein YbjT (DUF2867 family)
MRLLTRDPAQARHLEDELVEVGAGDLRDPRAEERATSGAQTVISAIQGFSGSSGYSPRTVDRQGNSNLIQAGFVMDTYDVSFDPSDTNRRYPSIPLTRLAEVARRDYAA